MESITNAEELLQQDPLDLSKQDKMIPCASLTVNNLFGSMGLLGGTGGVLTTINQNQSIHTNTMISIDGFKNDSMGQYIPIQDYDWQKPNIHKFVPSDSNKTTHTNYQRSKMENEIFWKMVSSNSIETVVAFSNKVQLGKSFRIDITKLEDDELKQSQFLKGMLFITTALLHTYSKEDERLWTKIYGTTFGLNKNNEEDNMTYVEQ